MKGYANPQLLVSASELAAGLDAPSGRPLIIDLRPPEAYTAGHIPGAVHLDLFGVSLIDTDPAPLKAFMWMIAHLLASRGVDGATPVVVYDEQSGVRAARAFWFLEYFGHPSVRLLDGGFGAWTRGDLPVTQGRGAAGGIDLDRLPRRRCGGDLAGRPRRHRPAAGGDPRHALGRRVSRHHSCARPVAAPSPARCTSNGRAISRPTAASSLPPSCEQMYEGAGVTPDREVITYCQGGYRAAHSYLALRLLGYPKVRNYVGSWKEWGDRTDLPIEVL